MLTYFKTAGLALLVFAGAACTQSETRTERTVTPEGDTVVSTTTTTSVIGLDTGKVEKAGERLETTGADIKENLKEGAGEVKSEWKETRQRIKNRTRDRDTVVVK